MPKTYHVTLVCTLWTKKITKNTVGSRGWVSSFVRKPLYVSFWRYTEFHTWKKSRNSVKFRGISRNHTSRNSAEFRRNCSQFRTEYGIDGSKKNQRNSVSAEFRGHPKPKTRGSAPIGLLPILAICRSGGEGGVMCNVWWKLGRASRTVCHGRGCSYASHLL